MTDRSASWTGAMPPARLAAAAAAVSLALGALLAHALAGRRAGAPAPATASATARATLPLTARLPVSATLGASDPRYRVGRGADGDPRAENPAERLQAEFTPRGALIGSGATRVGLALSGVGFGAALAPVAPAAPQAQANRVLYERASVGEWYVNGPLGLEQGFTLAHAPAGAASAGPLTLSLELSGDATATLARGGASVLLAAPGAAALRYGGLTVTDASGRELHSWLALRGGHILLRADARGARYPLRVDPLVQQAELSGGGEVGSGWLGYSVALSADGSTALVGAPKDDGGIGAAWVFVRSGGSWAEQAELSGGEAAGGGATEQCGQEAQEEIEGCGFGRSVALSGDGNTALVGSPRTSDAAGAARVFVREGEGWSERATLTGVGETTEGRFGKSVALSADGGTALVGATANGDGNGAAWIFTRADPSGSQWSAGQELTGAGERGEGHFGVSVALSSDGSTALVGGPTDAGTSAGQYIGAAWVFARSGSSWTQQGAKLVAGGQELGEGHFGYSVALSGDGDTALIGARADDEGAGAAWVFTRSGEAWSEGPELTSPAPGKVSFGYSVALSGDGQTALVGAPKQGGGRGAAQQFVRSGSEWVAGEQLTAGEGEAGGGWFGASVALSADGSRALVGAPTDGGGAGAAWPYGPGPAVTAVSPREGPVGGGTVVTITGVDFGEVEEVRFGQVGAPGFTVDSPTAITVASPASGATGSVHVTVRTASGTSTATSGDVFRYVSSRKADTVAPVVTSVSPAEGPAAGGTIVTISGSHLGEASAVDFGSTPASSFTVKSGGSIAAVAPAQGAGTVDVTVTGPQGTSTVKRPEDQFTYLPASSAGGGSGAGSSSGQPATSTGAVLAVGPLARPGCAVALLSRGVAVTATRKRATIGLSSKGLAFAGTCSGRLTIYEKVRLKSARGHRRRFGVKAIGTAKFSIRTGTRASVAVKLNSAGRALLASHHGRMSAKLVILQALPAPASTHSAIVHLAVHRRHDRKPKPKSAT